MCGAWLPREKLGILDQKRPERSRTGCKLAERTSHGVRLQHFTCSVCVELTANVSGLERESCRADFQRWYSAQFRTTEMFLMFMMFMMSMSSRHIRYPMSDVHEMYALHVNLGDGRVVLRWSARGRNLRFAKFESQRATGALRISHFCKVLLRCSACAEPNQCAF